jgi:hypothetical protein
MVASGLPTSHSVLATGNGVHTKHYWKVKKAAPSGTLSTAGNLAFAGGDVLVSPAIYIDYWGPEWAAGFSTGGYSSAAAQAYINAFFANLGGSPWLSITTQYCQGAPAGATGCPSGSAMITNPPGQLKGTWNDSANAVPSSPVDADIEREVARAVSHFGSNPNAVYMVFTPSGKSESGFGTNWCAWHGWNSAVGNVAYAYIPYQPDAGRSCGMNFTNRNDAFGHGYFDGFSIVGGHEYTEAVTDPFPNSGWLDSASEEIADKCAWSSASGNITLGSNFFAAQPLWSNAGSSCAMGYQPAEWLGGVLSSGPASASWSSKRLDAFVRGSDNQLWHRCWDGTNWSGWEPLGGVLGASPAADSWSLNRLDVFVRGGDGQLWHKWWDGRAWSGWEPLGGRLAGAPAVTSWGANRLDVLVEGTDSQLWHKWWDGNSWGGWEPLGGVINADPAAASSASNRIDVLVRGSDSQLWHKSWNGTAWSNWDAQGGTLTSGLGASTWGTNRLDVFALGNGGALLRKSFDGTAWSGWRSYGGQWTSGPSAVSPAVGEVDVFMRGGDNALWRMVLGS